MTDSLRAPIESLNYNDTEYTYLTGPSSSPHSINNLHDASLSTIACLPLLTQQQSQIYSAILIACFSPHPLPTSHPSPSSTSSPQASAQQYNSSLSLHKTRKKTDKERNSVS
ncbi:MAG: hypothetical protein Q9181_007079 [Wetmoreana brouardii]